MNQGYPSGVLSKAAAVVAVGVLGWTAFYAVDEFAPQWLGREPAAPTHAAQQGGGPAVSIDYNVEEIVAAHLFGDASASKEPEPRKVEAPETKLRLSLVGLIASADSQFARALIEVNRGKVAPYRVGQQIEGTDARLKSVERQRVLLERGGALESLPMNWRRLAQAESVLKTPLNGIRSGAASGGETKQRPPPDAPATNESNASM
jgi:general secretion pathway protein C